MTRVTITTSLKNHDAARKAISRLPMSLNAEVYIKAASAGNCQIEIKTRKREQGIDAFEYFKEKFPVEASGFTAELTTGKIVYDLCEVPAETEAQTA